MRGVVVFFNEISNDNYSSRIFFPWKVEHLIPLELPSVNDGAFAIFFCIWLCSCHELFFALFHCTAITIFYTVILTRKVDLPSFFMCETSEKIRKINFKRQTFNIEYNFFTFMYEITRDLTWNFLLHAEKHWPLKGAI